MPQNLRLWDSRRGIRRRPLRMRRMLRQEQMMVIVLETSKEVKGSGERKDFDGGWMWDVIKLSFFLYE